MSDIVASVDAGVLHVTLNRPSAGNTVSDEMVIELTGLIAQAGDRADLVLLRGAGADFCLGRARPPGASRPSEALDRRDKTEIVFSLYRTIRNAKVPVVCGVQGQAIGFGCAIAAICDMTIAADDATFSTPEMEHGILPTVVLSTFLDRIPRKAINYLIYSSMTITAERALTFGIVCDVVPAKSLDGALQNIARSIRKAPPIAIRGVKEYMRSAADMSIEGAVDYARNVHAIINASPLMRANKS